MLLADANEEFRAMLKESIEQSGEFAVVGSVGDGLSALHLIEEKKPRLLLMDLLLPELDGFGLLDRLASMQHRPRTILLTSAYRSEIVARAMERDVSFFMPKPCEMGSLLERMRQAAGAGAEGRGPCQARPSL